MLPLIPLPIGETAEEKAQKSKTKSHGDERVMSVGSVQVFGSMHESLLKFGDYVVLDDWSTVLKRVGSDEGDSDSARYEMHLKTALIPVTRFVRPMACETSTRLLQEMYSEDGKTLLEGKFACGTILPGSITVNEEVDDEERWSYYKAFMDWVYGEDRGKTTVPTIQKGDKRTFLLGDSKSVEKEYEIDMFWGVFTKEFPPREHVASEQFIKAALKAGLNWCQATFLQVHLSLYMEMLDKLPDLLVVTPKNPLHKKIRLQFTELEEYLKLVRAPLHARYCYYRSTRSKSDLVPPQNDSTKFCEALLWYLYPNKPPEEMEELVFFFAFASQVNQTFANELLGRDPTIVSGVRDKMRNFLNKNQKSGAIGFTGSKVTFVGGELWHILAQTHEYVELANVFTYITIKNGELYLYGLGIKVASVPFYTQQVVAYATISLTSLLFTTMVLTLLVKELIHNYNIAQQRAALFKLLHDGGTVTLEQKQGGGRNATPRYFVVASDRE